MPRSTRNPVRRRHILIIVIAAIIALAILLFRAPPASALCVASTPEEYVERADVIFRGEVASIEPPAERERFPGVSLGGHERAVIEANTVWKGKPQPEFLIEKSGPVSRFTSFDEGSEYLIFAREEGNGEFSIHQCDGSRPVDHSYGLLTFLGDGTPVDPDSASQTTGDFYIEAATTDLESGTPVDSDSASQITGDDYMDAVTTERLMLLGMLGLVALTFLYLRWRPPRYDDDSDEARRLDE